MNWLKTVMALLQFAPLILQMIAQVEAIFHPPAPLTTAPTDAAPDTPKQDIEAIKKAVVMSVLEGAPSEVVDKAGTFVDKTVGALNSAGVFKH